MKHSQTIGIIAAVLVIALCFFPWSYIASRNLTVSGMEATGTNFGKPGLFNIILCSIMIVMFLVPRIWAKRTNVFMAALNLAWSFRNFLLVSSCMMGECPERKPALIAILVLAVVAQVMALLPKVAIPKKTAV
jgi:long-subunit acyl-CoA synthetase (AMP-forming)